MNERGRQSESGQILVVMATGLLFVVLGATALAVDWGNGLLQKRRLQTTADAAALSAAYELQRGGTIGSAVTAAQTIVSTNTGGTITLAYPGTGSGANLTDGIELTDDGDVRVVLNRQVKAMFAAVLGMNSLPVRVRSRASVGPYGLLPIGVKRFSEGDTSLPLGSGRNPNTTTDYLATAATSTISYWPSPINMPAASSPGYTPPTSYDPSVSGTVMALIGQNALANVANGNDFHFFVAPDIRGITQAIPDFFNGVESSTAAQLLKNMESGYFLSKGYPGPNPVVGDQIGVLNGTTTSLTVDAMRKSYGRGDVVTAMVYDGTVYRKPQFTLQLDSAIKTATNIGPGGSPVDFQLSLLPIYNFTSSGVQFWATGLGSWADWSFASGPANATYVTPVSGSGLTFPFSVSSSTVVQGAKTALITGYDPGTGNLATASASVVVGSSPVYSMSCPQAYQVVQTGSATRFDLYLHGWNGYSHSDVTVRPIQWFTTGANPTPTSAPNGVSVSLPSEVDVRSNRDDRLRVSIDTTANADIGQWNILVSVTDGNSANDQMMYLTLVTVPPDTQPTAGSTTSFIVLLGYANYVITYANNASSPSPSLDNNTIYAYSVSPLMPDLSMLGRGLSSRLMGWNQTR